MNKQQIIYWARLGYKYLGIFATGLQPVLLLVIRLYWGWQFFQTGKGKLGDIGKVIGFFTDLGIPFPAFNAYMVGCTECFCGLLLLLGIASRVTTIPLIISMTVAYITADREAVMSIFSDPDKFFSATPFLFLMAVVIVFVFGPGVFSVDGLLKKIIRSPQDDMGNRKPIFKLLT